MVKVREKCRVTFISHLFTSLNRATADCPSQQSEPTMWRISTDSALQVCLRDVSYTFRTSLTRVPTARSVTTR